MSVQRPNMSVWYLCFSISYIFMSNYPQRVTNWVLDIIFPKKCLGCNKFSQTSEWRTTNALIRTDGGFDYVCKKCFREIEVKNTLECVGCKRKTKFGLTCVSCREDSPLDRIVIAADLSNHPIDKMLKAYKYKFITDMALPLAIIMRKSVKKALKKGLNLFEDNPLLVPVPLHRKRLNWRGFNQAELLVKNISDAYHISYNADVLKRVSNTKHQADAKSRQERLNNVKDNFALSDAGAVRGRTVVLIDDICTTGATLNECARVLKNPPVGGGAKRVIGFVVARGQFKIN